MVDDLLGLLDEGDDVAHAQDALGHAVRVEGVEVRGLLARAHIADRDARDGLHRQRGTAAGIAVQLGQDDASEGRGFVELGSHVDGLLAEGGVGDEEDLVREGFEVDRTNWLRGEPAASERITVKIRYAHPGTEATVDALPGGKARIQLDTPQRAITPGQAAVFYDGDVVVGGGWITREPTPVAA